MHRSIDAKRDEIAALCRRFGVRKLEVFGSAARGADFDPAASDADFLVEFDPDSRLRPLDEFVGLQAALAALLGRSVDLIEASAVRNPYIRATIERGRELVYAG